jgi:hypothetical protein
LLRIVAYVPTAAMIHPATPMRIHEAELTREVSRSRYSLGIGSGQVWVTAIAKTLIYALRSRRSVLPAPARLDARSGTCSLGAHSGQIAD